MFFSSASFSRSVEKRYQQPLVTFFVGMWLCIYLIASQTASTLSQHRRRDAAGNLNPANSVLHTNPGHEVHLHTPRYGRDWDWVPRFRCSSAMANWTLQSRRLRGILTLISGWKTACITYSGDFHRNRQESTGCNLAHIHNNGGGGQKQTQMLGNKKRISRGKSRSTK